MKNFDEKLLRLKQAVKLTADQDVAALLGMTKAAFYERKKRDAFPDEKVMALASLRPDLKLAPLEILLGPDKSAVVDLTLAEIRATMATMPDKSGSIPAQLARAKAIIEAKSAPLAPDEQLLLDAYRQASIEQKQRLLLEAMGGAHGLQKKGKLPKTSGISVGSVHGQQVIGDQTNHGSMTFGVSPPSPGKKSRKS